MLIAALGMRFVSHGGEHVLGSVTCMPRCVQARGSTDLGTGEPEAEALGPVAQRRRALQRRLHASDAGGVRAIAVSNRERLMLERKPNGHVVLASADAPALMAPVQQI